MYIDFHSNARTGLTFFKVKDLFNGICFDTVEGTRIHIRMGKKGFEFYVVPIYSDSAKLPKWKQKLSKKERQALEDRYISNMAG